MSNLLDCQSITAEYPTQDGILRLYGDGVNLSVDEGDFISIVGASGWGKSTLVNIILGLEKPSHGTIHIRGQNQTTQSFVSRCSKLKMAVVFQRPTAIPHLTVIQNLHLALSMLGIPRRDRDERIHESIRFFGLENLSHSRPDSLSAGQKKRIDLARALASRPEFLVLDEPTGDLDTSMANLVMPLLRGLNRDHKTTILMTTAIPRHVSSNNDRLHLKPPSFLVREPKIIAASRHV